MGKEEGLDRGVERRLGAWGSGVNKADSKRLEEEALSRWVGGCGGAVVENPVRGKVLVICLKVVVQVPWVPGTAREPRDAVLHSPFSPAALNASIRGCVLVVTFLLGRRDRGRFVIGAGLD